MSARLRQFFALYRPYSGWLAADLLCACLVSLIAIALPLLGGTITRMVIDSSAQGDVWAQIAPAAALMVGLIAVYSACDTFVDYYGHRMGALIERDLRARLFAHVQRLPFSFHDSHKTGALMAHLTGDSLAVSEMFHHAPEDAAIALLKFTGVFLVLLAIDVPLALIVFAFVPFAALYAWHFYMRMLQAGRRSREHIAGLNTRLEETLAGVRVVQSFTRHDLETARFAEENARFLQSRSDGYRAEALFTLGMSAMTQLFPLLVIVFGGVRLAQGALDAPALITFLLCVGILIDPINRAVNIARLLQEGMTVFNRMIDLLEVEPAIADSPDAIALDQVCGDIRFEQVRFSYTPDASPVLDGLSLHIRAGEYVALVGASGVGKTTLLSLIPRFYEVSSGSITLDGIDIRSIRLESLRRQIGVVQQDVYLFSGTVADNIRYGQLDAPDEAVIAAAQRAGAHAFIMALPHGYQTEIGQRGVKLSGGQRQRLSIARVFLKDPPILLLDEATSALDNASERAVQAALDALAHDRTVLVIAHRLSTVRRAGRILVLGERGIVEEGTHDSLLAAGGAYAALYHNL